jgi:hypothetical protein
MFLICERIRIIYLINHIHNYDDSIHHEGHYQADWDGKPDSHSSM